MTYKTYRQSIGAVAAAHVYHKRYCELAETDDVIDVALAKLHKAIAEHTARFGKPVCIDGMYWTTRSFIFLDCGLKTYST